ncbi:MAG: spheroidene monooxygenase [Rhodobacteraceae bacterium]|nr:spheroidene monooxygenase [Paracoccaceae bacterium]
MQAISLSLFRFSGVKAKLWAFTQMQWARAPLRAEPDIGFFKLMGTGTREGFHPAPNFGVYAILATWPDLDIARRRIADAPVFQRYRANASENWTVYISAVSARGQWAGAAPFEVGDAKPTATPEPIAVLTRATLKPQNVPAFWRHTPDIGADIRAQTELPFKIGMGEVPWLHQVTFSIWESAEAMRAFAYKSRPHAEAIAAVRAGDWFSEELFARFQVLGAEGRWEGREPLQGLM